jgi:hypothetical protein
MKKMMMFAIAMTLGVVALSGCGSKDDTENVKEPASATPDPDNPNVKNPAAIEGDGIGGPGAGKGGK